MNNEDFNWHVFLGFATVMATAVIGCVIYLLSMLSLKMILHGIGIFLSILILSVTVVYLLGVVGMLVEKAYDAIKYRKIRR